MIRIHFIRALMKKASLKQKDYMCINTSNAETSDDGLKKWLATLHNRMFMC